MGMILSWHNQVYIVYASSDEAQGVTESFYAFKMGLS